MIVPRTICAKCSWCKISTSLRTHRSRVGLALVNRLDYRCGMIVHDQVIDRVTGNKYYLSHEAKFLTEEKHPSCEDMNCDGECAMYEEIK